jgi:hypothetical protein
MKSRIAAPETPELKNGQVWELEDKCLEVKHVGRFLVEFIYTSKQGHEKTGRRLRTPKQIESIRAVLEFLKTHRAVLQPSSVAP